MSSLNEAEMSAMGYEKTFDYSQYSYVNNVNVIPEKDFKRLVEDSFTTIADILRPSYGPYGSVMLISEQNETTTTKDGYNIFCAMGFSHAYKRMVYLAIKKIIERVNKNVGDGTTSCILLAEKMFKNLEGCIHTPDDKRDILKILSDIEKNLQNPKELDEDKNVIRPLTYDALKGLLSIAGNYDDDLSSVLMQAFEPVMDDDLKITELRNPVVEASVDQDGESNVNYEIDFLPGDYRVRINMALEATLLFQEPRKIRVVLYDHAFGSSDWNFFMKDYDKTTETLILARTFNRSFMDNEYVRYCKERELTKSPITILLAEVKGDYFTNEIADLAAILQTNPLGLEARAVDHKSLPVAMIQIHKGNCMCFFTDFIPEEYITNIEHEMHTDTSESMISRNHYLKRIKALRHQNKDTMITVKAGTSLELKMITDKIDDCVCAVNSAMTYGIVPNMLVYGDYRIRNLERETDNELLFNNVVNSISTSIHALFKDIWMSKHGESFAEKLETITNDLYADMEEPDSFDIIHERFCDATKLPSSVQYDLEVIVAAISIVKYLLTSRALIFDAHLMQQVTDTGHYEQM